VTAGGPRGLLRFSLRGTLGGSRNSHDGRVVDVGAPDDVSQAFAMDVLSPDNLADLMGGRVCFATELATTPDGAGSSFAGARAN
jgi:hypothetical protein